MLQWPIASSKKFVDIFDPAVEFNLDDLTEGVYINPLLCFFMFRLMTGAQGRDGTRCVKYLIPSSYSAEDPYAMKDFERLVMPRPKDESNEKVPVLGWEFLALLSVLIAMAPWFTWRPSQESRRLSLPLGSLDDAERWYAEKLVWYSSFYHRESVLKAIQQRMETFFKECEPAWQQLEVTKGMNIVVRARKASHTPTGRPSGAPAEPSTGPVDLD